MLTKDVNILILILITIIILIIVFLSVSVYYNFKFWKLLKKSVPLVEILSIHRSPDLNDAKINELSLPKLTGNNYHLYRTFKILNSPVCITVHMSYVISNNHCESIEFANSQEMSIQLTSIMKKIAGDKFIHRTDIHKTGIGNEDLVFEDKDIKSVTEKLKELKLDLNEIVITDLYLNLNMIRI